MYSGEVLYIRNRLNKVGTNFNSGRWKHSVHNVHNAASPFLMQNLASALFAEWHICLKK